MKLKEHIEKMDKKLNVVIMGFGELGQGFYDILKKTDSNVYVVSVSGKNNEQYKNAGIEPYNRYEGFPVPYDDIDVVLLACRTQQLDTVKTLIPDEILPKIADKMISFQNGFGVRDQLVKLFGKSVSRSIPYLSFKRNDGENIKLTFAKPSPIKGLENQKIKDLIDTMNKSTHDEFGEYLFEGVDSIALHRDGEYKATINAVLNSICVVYKGDVKTSMEKFKDEFGDNVLYIISKEISNIMNSRLNDILDTNPKEVEYRIKQIARKFENEVPSTYNQYYVNAIDRKEVLSDDDSLLGYLIDQADKSKIEVPICREIRSKMKKLEKDINDSYKKDPGVK